MKPWLTSEDWQLEYAQKILNDMRTNMKNNFEPYLGVAYKRSRPGSVPRPGWVPRPGPVPRWQTARTPTFNLWYPGDGADFVVTDRGDLDNGGEFGTAGREQGSRGRTWVTFKWPTVKIEYRDGQWMSKLTAEVTGDFIGPRPGEWLG